MEDFIPTRVSRIKRDAVKEFVSIDYKNPKKKRTKEAESKEDNNVQTKVKSEENESVDVKKKQDVEMKRVRYEVMKFGMSGFKGVEAEKAEVALAVSLGAKPPKKKGINYKMLKEERKSKREAEKMDVGHVSGLEKSLTKHKTKKLNKKGSDGILGVYGKVNKKTVGKRR